MAIQRNLIAGFSDKKCDRYTTYHEFAHHLFPDWIGGRSKTLMRGRIREITRKNADRYRSSGQMPASDDSDRERNYEWYRRCYDSYDDLLRSIVLLEESGLDPDNIVGDNESDMQLLKSVWEYLRSSENGSSDFVKYIELYRNRDVLNKSLSQIFGGYDFGADLEKIIVFHGFMYIFPQQERIFRMLEDSGFRLVFLIHYDRRYPASFECWEKTLEQGFPPKSEWCYISDQNEPKYSFGELIESGRTERTGFGNARLVEYSSLAEFAQDAGHYTGRGRIYSPANGTASEIINSLNPELFGNYSMKLTNYPVGRFVIDLVESWDPECSNGDNMGAFSADYNRMERFLQSGWVTVGGRNSRSCLGTYRKCKSAFRLCRTVDDWHRRLQQIEKGFDSITSKLDDYEALTYWAPLSISECELKQFKNTICRYLDMLDSLNLLCNKGSASDGKMPVKVYLRQLRTILKNESEPDLPEKEKMVYKDILDCRLYRSREENEFYVQDMADQVSYAIGGYTGESEDRLVDHEQMVGKMYNIDGAYATQSSEAHICLADFGRLPGNDEPCPWPLSRERLEKIADCSVDKGDLLHFEIRYLENQRLYSRYLVFCALKCDKAVISWISKMDGKILPPSPYIALISEYLESKQPILRETGVRSTYEPKQITPFDIIQSSLKEEEKFELSMCSLRYLYGYVLQDHPAYYSEFHETFLRAGMQRYIVENQQSYIGEYLKEIFGDLHDTETRECVDIYAKNKISGGAYNNLIKFIETHKKFDAEYPRGLLLEMLRNGNPIKDISTKRFNLEDSLADARDLFLKICMFCPHSDRCTSRNRAFSSKIRYWY